MCDEATGGRGGIASVGDSVFIRSMTPEICPNCGAPVPARSKACPNCGSDEQTGWSGEASASGLDLPDDSFDYNEFAQREFGGKKALPHGIHWFWWMVAALLAALFLWGGFKWLL
jgi:hypothetical protein